MKRGGTNTDLWGTPESNLLQIISSCLLSLFLKPLWDKFKLVLKIHEKRLKKTVKTKKTDEALSKT